MRENALQLALLFRLPKHPLKIQKTGAKCAGLFSQLNLFLATSLLALADEIAQPTTSTLSGPPAYCRRPPKLWSTARYE